jgi:hypothetical protein
MHSENTKFELKQFEVMSEILMQLKFVFFLVFKAIDRTPYLLYVCFLFYTFIIFIILLLHAVNTCS